MGWNHTDTDTHRGKWERKKAKKIATGKWAIYLPDDVERELCFSLP